MFPLQAHKGIKRGGYRVLLIMSFFFLTSCARGGSDRFYFGSYSEAEQLYNKGEYEKAIEKYQAYVDENPEGNLAVISLYYMAKSHAALGHVGEAKSLYQRIIRDYPKLVWADFSETQLKGLEEKAAPAQRAEVKETARESPPPEKAEAIQEETPPPAESQSEEGAKEESQPQESESEV